MKSAWVDSDAQAAVEQYARRGVGGDLALARLHHAAARPRSASWCCMAAATPRSRPACPISLGEETDVLCVKGTGWDMGAIEPAGLPAVRLDAAAKLRKRDALSDEDMVRVQRANLLDPMAPNPSVETLLHAFVPHKFVDHTHATAVLGLVDQPNGAGALRRALQRPHGLRALHHAGLRPRQEGGRGLRGETRRSRA